jgi:hypothetical protein
MSMTLLVNIDVDDLHKGIEFYTKAFGLTIGRRFGADAVELLGPSICWPSPTARLPRRPAAICARMRGTGPRSTWTSS